jgi:hypothetical protein
VLLQTMVLTLVELFSKSTFVNFVFFMIYIFSSIALTRFDNLYASRQLKDNFSFHLNSFRPILQFNLYVLTSRYNSHSIMAPDAEIIDYRVFGKKGMGVAKAIAAAIDEAVDDGCDIINMSLGGPRPFGLLKKAVAAAHEAGVIIVVAAGNEGDGNPLSVENS